MTRKIIGILRGIKPTEIIDAVEILLESGITTIEVPMNSPDPYESIEKMVDKYKGQGLFGAGTVLSVSQVEDLNDIGCEMIVSPNCNKEVIFATKQYNMLSYPGVMTPTEAFAALDAGADGLKLFPGDLISPIGVKAMKAVLPADVDRLVTGGAHAGNFQEWIDHGATGFGIGSALYKAGMDLKELKEKAVEIVKAYDACVK